uniref:Adrenoceptor alpha 1D n=1 Tax=Cyprinus carpio TaxID=7962 RepID=A0A8C2HKA3_CYPCA
MEHWGPHRVSVIQFGVVEDAIRSSLSIRPAVNTTCEGITLDSQVIGVGVFLAVFILVAIVGNILVILSVLCNKHLQTVTNFFIVNLAIADLLLSIIVLPFSASLEVLGCWVFGRVFCNIWAAVDVLCCTASILSLCIISIDRYIGVKYCLKYPTIMTERKAGVILVVVWVSSMVISIGPLLGWKEPPPSDESICRITEEPGYALFSSLFSFYLPLMVILVIVAVILFRRSFFGSEGTRNLSKGCHIVHDALAKRKFSLSSYQTSCLPTTKCFFTSLSFFFASSGSFFPALKPSEMVFKVIFWLGYFNSCINPVIYPCSSKEFQRAFTRLVRCQCQRRRRILRRFYDQRWRTAMRGARRDPHRDYCSGFPFHEQCGNTIYSCQSKSRPLSLKSWSFFPPLQKSSIQLKEKMNNLSNKIKNGTGKSSTSALARTEIDTVSMGIYNDCGDQSGYQIYDLTECYGLKETDI